MDGCLELINSLLSATLPWQVSKLKELGGGGGNPKTRRLWSSQTSCGASGRTAVKTEPGWSRQGAAGWPSFPVRVWGQAARRHPASICPARVGGTAGQQMLLRGLLLSAPPPVVLTFI